MGAGFEQGLQQVLVVVAGQQQPVEQLKENSEELLLSSPHEHRQWCLFTFPLLVACGPFCFAFRLQHKEFHRALAVGCLCSSFCPWIVRSRLNVFVTGAKPIAFLER